MRYIAAIAGNSWKKGIAVTNRIIDTWCPDCGKVVVYVDGTYIELSMAKATDEEIVTDRKILILQGTRIKGRNKRNDAIADDLLCGDYSMDENGYNRLENDIFKALTNDGSPKESARKIAVARVEKIMEYCRKKDDELFVLFRNGATNFSVGMLQKVALDMIEKFRNNTTYEFEFTDDDLTDAVKMHPNSIKFISAVKNEIKSLLKERKYIGKDTEKLTTLDGTEEIYNQLKNQGVRNPKFNLWSDIIFGLKFIINDVWAYQVHITKYVTKGNCFAANLEFTYWDHFGLDCLDIAKFDQPLFCSWFVLQHFKGYKPFITKIIIAEEICCGEVRN